MKTKRFSYIALALIAVLIAGVGVTLSYFVTSIKTANIVQFGHIKMQLIETEMGADGVERPVDLEKSVNITRNNTVDRRLKVKNIGNHPAYIRVRLNFELAENTGDDIQQYLSFDFDEANWIFEDGWYYYKAVLQPGETTTSLMTTLEFDDNALSTHYPDSKIVLDVDAQAVQSDNNALEVLQVEGWPEE